MSVGIQKNIMSVLVGKDSATAIASVQITDPTNSGTYIADGQIIMLGANDAVVQAGETVVNHPAVRFVQRSGSDLHFSARMRGVDFIKASSAVSVPTQYQVSTVGFNGTSGSIDTTGTDYFLTFVGNWDDIMWSKQKYRKVWDYTSTSPTQLSVASTFSKQMNLDGFYSNLNGVPPQFKVEMLSDATAAGVAVGNLTAVNGSDIVTVADTLTVGQIIRIGGLVSTSDPVYIIVATPATDSSLAAGTYRIHTFYQGTSGTKIATTNWDTLGTGTNYGLVITGLPATWGIPPYSDFKYKVVSFNIELKGFNSTTSGTPTPAKLGTGVSQLVAEYEYFAQGNEGALNRTIIPLPTGRHDTVQGTAYTTVALESADKQGVSPITAPAAMRVQTFMFTPEGGTGNNLTALLSQLNPYLTSVGLATI